MAAYTYSMHHYNDINDHAFFFINGFGNTDYIFRWFYVSVSDILDIRLIRRYIMDTSSIRCRHVRSTLVVRSAFARHVRRTLVIRFSKSH